MRIAVLGAGSWGTALAVHAARLHDDVRLWGRSAETAERLQRERENPRYLPGLTFPRNLRVTAASEVVDGVDLVLVVVPSGAFRETLRWLRPRLEPGQVVAWATKGLETGTGAWLHEVAEAELGPGQPAALISGPSFAAEVARGQPTALTAASADPERRRRLADAFHGGSMRIYGNPDVIGVELGGAFKNVLAVASGIADGAGFGANARAALLTRGLAELQRLGEALGARPQTLTGLSGLGDLLLTCTDDQSRNRRVGLLLGQGYDLATARERVGQSVEGVETARVAVERAHAAGVEMPICEEVHAVLYRGRRVHDAVRRLLERDPVAENI
ncbi:MULTISPECIES: NAD(P)H-dependent glycerol-3-phosphate dehydrogenase [Thioalkalivibrio]|uniref:Glycerol-3-phosphate dehydrogenase [NAD(P)+] n=1 Tax=Thioalkalivibrio halophilus TaxID=252474 RepID=A0A1V2ZXR9_9GAMM|nr:MULTISPECIES: NAD(P)H-dependent glycerol-3-phosphate dehydrogenase [Thioalkalivibrio]OOC09811.1 glycerol-3-phosphate dehydrogenase [Thioalkalivibrio halophilus]PYG03591.1 glycerol 3-phosphate dehydrogenase (NAD(P)+) [Thioalkalivibrio sp. ALE21]